MKVLLFGATGMVGQGVLRECLLSPEVEMVLAIGRTSTGQHHAKLHEILHTNFLDYADVEGELSGYDACFYCLGVSSAGMTEKDYQHVTYDYTLAAAQAMIRTSPNLVMIYVSGSGTDSTEHGRMMWARVKGRTENALLQLPFRDHYMFRPGFIQPMHGIQSKTKLYRALYAFTSPLYPLLNALFSNYITATDRLGRAMIRVAKTGAQKHILENRDINALGL